MVVGLVQVRSSLESPHSLVLESFLCVFQIKQAGNKGQKQACVDYLQKKCVDINASLGDK